MLVPLISVRKKLESLGSTTQGDPHSLTALVSQTAEIISDPGANTSTLLPILVKADLYYSTNVPTDTTQITPGAAPGLDP